MTTRTRKWAILGALGLLSLDLALVGVAAPRARGWIESARGSALVRAGTIALRDLGAPGAQGIQDLSAALVTRFTHRSTNVYALILRATPREAARASALHTRREARWVMIEQRIVRTMVAEDAKSDPTAGATMSSCPTTGCPMSSGPKRTPEEPVTRSSATGLPISVLGVTME